MHKRMLGLSARVQALQDHKQVPALQNLLYQAQANDAYWHGLFGGLYLPHLRRAVYQAMVKLERQLDLLDARPARDVQDFDCDGHDELFLHNADLQAIVRLDGHASIVELDAYALSHNFGDTLARQSEHYYRKIQLNEHGHTANTNGIASPHDRVAFKQVIAAEDIIIDPYPRALFLDRWLDADSLQADLAPYHLDYHALESTGLSANFEAAVEVLKVRKTFRLDAHRLQVQYGFSGVARGWFSTELNIAMPSCDGPAGRYEYLGGIPGGFGQVFERDHLESLTLADEVLGGQLILSTSRPVRLHATPHFSVSQSEAGFEKIMQAVTLTLTWPLSAKQHEMLISLEILPL